MIPLGEEFKSHSSQKFKHRVNIGVAYFTLRLLFLPISHQPTQATVTEFRPPGGDFELLFLKSSGHQHQHKRDSRKLMQLRLLTKYCQEPLSNISMVPKPNL